MYNVETWVKLNSYVCSYTFIIPHYLLHKLNSSRSCFEAEVLHINEYHLKNLLKGCNFTEYARISSFHE